MYLIFNNVIISGYIGDFSIDSSLETIYRTFNFTLPYFFVKKNSLKEGHKIIIKINKNDSKNYFEGICLKSSDENNEIVKFMAVNYSWYLTVYEDTVQTKKGSAKEIIKSIIKTYEKSFDFQEIQDASFNIKIDKIYYEKSLESIIKEIIDEVIQKSSKKFYLLEENGTFKVVENLGNITIDLTKVSDLKRESDISNIKNQIKVFTATEKKISNPIFAKNSISIQEIGTIQKTSNFKSKNKIQAQTEANKLLKLYSNINKTVSLTIPGNFNIKIGYISTINNTTYILKSVKHEIKDAVFLTNISMEAYYG